MNTLQGLTDQEIQKRIEANQKEEAYQTMTNSIGTIIKKNVCTLFNFLNFMIALCLFLVHAYSNMIFIAIIILNILIGIFQEIKAKKIVDSLSLLNRPMAKVIRNGKTRKIDVSDLVVDDLLVLESGDQISNDSILIDGSLEVNESLITGESDAIIKKTHDSLVSGSFVISGKAVAKVVHVGSQNYIRTISDQVKKEKATYSELMDSMKKVTNITSYMILPLGILLFIEAIFLRGIIIDDAVVSSCAALLGMLPKGLVLLISVSLSTGVIRLAKQKILVQNIYALETLAHVDTICLDKTGTITNGTLKVISKKALQKDISKDLDEMVQSYLSFAQDNNATFIALRASIEPSPIIKPVKIIPFSSSRKWGSISFENGKTIFVGAFEKLVKESSVEVEEELEKGHRLLAIGYIEDIWDNDRALPENMIPLYMIVLEDVIRPNTKKTLDFFRKQGVEIKIISGDHPKTVAHVARRAGFDQWSSVVDMSDVLDSDDYDSLIKEYSIFARTTPQQKQRLVQALKKQGHHVAMTGDGVNDLLALREADCSIAVADGSEASRQISQIVLLDSNFTNLPSVLMEGRKVINNVTRTAQVFFIKTIYSILVTILCIITNQSFPFIPIQITLIDAFIEAYPSFITIVESDTSKIKGSFLRTSLSNAAPFALLVTILIMVIQLVGPFTEIERMNISYILLILLSILAVIKSCIPMTKLRLALCVSMCIGICLALMLFPNLFMMVSFTFEMVMYIVALFSISLMILIGWFLIKYKKV